MAPVLTGNLYLQDPTMIHLNLAGVPNFIIYSSHGGLVAHTSRDRVHWERVGAAFPRGLSWVSGYTKNRDPGDMWDPDISYVANGHGGATYWMYYAATQLGSRHSAIGA